MESKLLQIDGEKWTVTILGEQAITLQPEAEQTSISKIHKTVQLLEGAHLENITDIVPAYESLALIYSKLIDDLDQEVAKIGKAVQNILAENIAPQQIEIPVCYELGLDWDEVKYHTGVSKLEIIEKHISGSYTVAMLGFIPGFLYLSGLNKEIACPRKKEPRTKIPSGSVGIGGEQTGVYSLESPGGWQIIGRTPNSFFNAEETPPTRVKPGDKVTFVQISEKEFTELEEKG